MKILPMNNYQYNNSFEGNSVSIKNYAKTKQKLKNTNTSNNSGVSKFIRGFLAALGFTALTFFGACKKDDNKPIARENTDLVDFAFRDFVNLFNLDTIGQTKVLKHSYVLNEADSLVEQFDYPTTSDTLYANGNYYYNGSDPFMPRVTLFQSMWVRNGDEVIAKYTWPWEGEKHGKEMPTPNETRYINGAEGDNSMKMSVIPGSGGCTVDVTIKNDSAYYTLEDSIHFKRPFSANIKENY